MNEAFEKILKKIEEKRNKYQRLADGSNFDGWNEEDIKYSAKAEMCEELKEIVHEVAEEYHGGWIPCSKRLPEDAFGCLVTIIDCEPSTQTDFENILPYVVGYDGESWNDEDGNEIPFEVIAWKPLPEPYKERD